MEFNGVFVRLHVKYDTFSLTTTQPKPEQQQCDSTIRNGSVSNIYSAFAED